MLLATQMYSSFAPPGTPASMLVYILLRGWRAHQLTHTLVRHVIAQVPRLAPPPPSTPLAPGTPPTTQPSPPPTPTLHASISSVTATLSSLPISLSGNQAAGNRGFLKALGNAANFIRQLPFHAYTLLFASSPPLASPLTSGTFSTSFLSFSSILLPHVLIVFISPFYLLRNLWNGTVCVSRYVPAASPNPLSPTSTSLFIPLASLRRPPPVLYNFVV
jgi:hypothetical protein